MSIHKLPEASRENQCLSYEQNETVEIGVQRAGGFLEKITRHKNHNFNKAEGESQYTQGHVINHQMICDMEN